MKPTRAFVSMAILVFAASSILRAEEVNGNGTPEIDIAQIFQVSLPSASPLLDQAPPPTFTSCTVTTQCPDGQTNPLMCTGSYCSAGPNWVECNGTRQYCQCTVAACTSSTVCRKPHICNNSVAICYQGCCLCD